MPSELENAMESLITVFHRYASKDGKGTLNRRELRELMENELSNFLKVRRARGVNSAQFKRSYFAVVSFLVRSRLPSRPLF